MEPAEAEADSIRIYLRLNLDFDWADKSAMVTTSLR